MGWTCNSGTILFSTVLIVMTGSAAGSGLTPHPDQPVHNATRGMATTGITEGVVGSLVLSRGLPLADAMITATSLDQPAKPVPDIAIMTNSEGHFEWPLRPGAYRLVAVVDGREIACATAKVEPGRVTTLDLSGAP